MVGGVVREEFESAGEPQARALRIAQPVQLQASSLVGDGGPPHRTRGQVEALFVELGDQLPLLAGDGPLEQGFQRGLAAGVVREGLAVEFFRAFAVRQGPIPQAGQLYQRGGPIRPPQVRDGALQGSRRGGRVAELRLRLGQTQQGVDVVRVVLERALEERHPLRRVAQPAVPDLAHLGGESGLLEGAHGKLSLHLGHLEGELPPLLPCVDLSELDQRRLAGRVQAGDHLVGFRGPVDLKAALLEDLGQPEDDLRALLRVLLGVEVR